jgi:cell division transport system permease protein
MPFNQMFFTKLKRVIKAGFVDFWRNGVVSLASVLVLVVTLFVIGSILFSEALLTSALDQIKDKVDINVYFKTNAEEPDIAAIMKFLQTLPEVKSVTYTSRETALEDFKTRHADNSLIVSSLQEIGDNPLGASLNIKAKDPSQYASIAKILEGDTALSAGGSSIDTTIIDKVNYNQNKLVIDRLTGIITATQKLGWAFAVILSVIAILVTFNTIRLAIYTSREEIAIMKLVGASNNYVSGPFMFEGVMYGAAATVIAMFLLYGTSVWLGPTTAGFFGGLNLYLYFVRNFFQIFGILLISGILLGMLSSWLAVRRYLRV